MVNTGFDLLALLGIPPVAFLARLTRVFGEPARQTEWIRTAAQAVSALVLVVSLELATGKGAEMVAAVLALRVAAQKDARAKAKAQDDRGSPDVAAMGAADLDAKAQEGAKAREWDVEPEADSDGEPYSGLGSE